jgi:arylsulfatase A-like enzyme
LWEGGIRVPFLFRWPGRIPAGKIYSKPIIALDIFPTVVAAAGGQLPKDREIDGVNLLPYLTGAKVDSPHEVLFWRYSPRGNSFAIRRGNMKLLIHRGQPSMLFDLAMDVGEKHDQSKEKPQVAERLKKELMAWNAKMPKASR